MQKLQIQNPHKKLAAKTLFNFCGGTVMIRVFLTKNPGSVPSCTQTCSQSKHPARSSLVIRVQLLPSDVGDIVLTLRCTENDVWWHNIPHRDKFVWREHLRVALNFPLSSLRLAMYKIFPALTKRSFHMKRLCRLCGQKCGCDVDIGAWISFCRTVQKFLSGLSKEKCVSQSKSCRNPCRAESFLGLRSWFCWRRTKKSGKFELA